MGAVRQKMRGSLEDERGETLFCSSSKVGSPSCGRLGKSPQIAFLRFVLSPPRMDLVTSLTNSCDIFSLTTAILRTTLRSGQQRNTGRFRPYYDEETFFSAATN